MLKKEKLEGNNLMDNTSITMDILKNQKRNGISGSTLKLIAIFIMLIDHIGAAIIEKILKNRGLFDLDWNNTQALEKFFQENELLCSIDAIFRTIGRLAFPIFCFLLVEGFVHTHNKWKYAIRLGIFAIVSEVPFDLAFFDSAFCFRSQNVFFTLFISLLVLIGFELISDVIKDKKWLPILAIAGAILTGCIEMPFTFQLTRNFFSIVSRNCFFGIEMNNKEASIIIGVIISIISLLIYIIMIKKTSIQKASIRFAKLAVLIAGMVLAEYLKSDYFGFGVLTIAVMYGLRRNRINAMLGGCTTLAIMSIGEFSSFLNLLLMNLYNGKRGCNLKYLFYLFYPVHLLVLYLIAYFMKIV